jgi:hypothetical protein
VSLVRAARNERFAGFAQVSEGAVLFGGIRPSIMSPTGRKRQYADKSRAGPVSLWCTTVRSTLPQSVVEALTAPCSIG